MKIKSEKQSRKLCEPSAESHSGPLQFDPEKYRKYLPETDWSEKAQDELHIPVHRVHGFQRIVIADSRRT